MTPSPIRTGCGGWTFEPWRGVFFPPTVKQKDELAYMSRQLRSIDINLHVTHRLGLNNDVFGEYNKSKTALNIRRPFGLSA